MKLLIVTQVVDKNHPILGFFHRWIEEFSKHCEVVHVICLQAGEYQLPSNVYVHSLGKEQGKGRLVYLYRFYKYIWMLRHEYDQVFVHMNQLYVILGAPVWLSLGKKVGLWYAHGAVTKSLRLAVALSSIVFTSTKQGLALETKKRVIVGQGIDTKIFTQKFKEPSIKLRLVTVGRISQSKNIETLLKACSRLKEKHASFQFQIVGVPTTVSEEMYARKMKLLVNELHLENLVQWMGSVSNYELPPLLQNSDIFIHDGSTNSLDKALLEASLCGCIVISSNPSYRALTQNLSPEYLYEHGDDEELLGCILSAQPPKLNLQEEILKIASLEAQILKIVKNYNLK